MTDRIPDFFDPESFAELSDRDIVTSSVLRRIRARPSRGPANSRVGRARARTRIADRRGRAPDDAIPSPGTATACAHGAGSRACSRSGPASCTRSRRRPVVPSPRRPIVVSRSRGRQPAAVAPGSVPLRASPQPAEAGALSGPGRGRLAAGAVDRAQRHMGRAARRRCAAPVPARPLTSSALSDDIRRPTTHASPSGRTRSGASASRVSFRATCSSHSPRSGCSRAPASRLRPRVRSRSRQRPRRARSRPSRTGVRSSLRASLPRVGRPRAHA